jgi:hypothetical protein
MSIRVDAASDSPVTDILEANPPQDPHAAHHWPIVLQFA